MRRVVSAAMALLLMFSFVAGLQAPQISAQATASGGEAVVLTDAAGLPMLEISVDSFTPGFTGHTSSYAPDRGFEYAHITVTVTNLSEAPFAPNYYNFKLIDTEGFISNGAYVVVDNSVALPMVGSSAIEPGESASSSVIFQVLVGTEAAAIGYSITWERLTLLAANANFPVLGDTVEILDNNARPLGTVTVDEWLDPLPGVDPSTQPNRGYHYAGAVLTIENTGGAAWPIDIYAFKIVDADGYRSNGTSAFRRDADIPDLRYDDLRAGDSVTGVVAFQVFNTAAPAFIVYESGDQMIFISSFPDAPTAPSLADIPALDDIDLPVSVVDDGDDAGEDAVEMSPACVEADDFLTDLFDRLDGYPALSFDVEDAVDMSADELIDLQEEIEDIRDELRSEDAPEMAEDFFTAFLGVVDYMIESLDDLIDAAENGDDLQPVIDAIVENSTAFDTYFAEANTLFDACPGLS